MPSSFNITETDDKYDKHHQRWKKNFIAYDGGDAVREAGEMFLPKTSPDQTKAQYEQYKNLAWWLPATGLTVASWVGLALSDGIKVAIPDELKALADDFDAEGTPIESVADQAATFAIICESAWILTEYPDSQNLQDDSELDGNTVLSGFDLNALQGDPDEEFEADSGIIERPRSVIYPRDQVLMAVSKRSGLPYYKITEREQVIDDDDRLMDIERYIILDMVEPPEDAGGVLPEGAKYAYRKRIIEYQSFVGAAKGEVLPDVEDVFFPIRDGEYLTFIPIVKIGASNNNPQEVGQAPISKVVDTNEEHYRHWAERTLIKRAAIPTPYIAGADTKKDLEVGQVTIENPTTKVKQRFWQVNLGIYSSYVFANPSAKIEYAEVNGKTLSESRQDLDTLYKVLASLGATALLGRQSTQESYEHAVHVSKDKASTIKRLTQNMSSGLTEALRTQVWWSQPNADWEDDIIQDCSVVVSYDVNDAKLDAAGITALYKAMLDGAITVEQFVWNMVQGERLDPNIPAEDHVEYVKEWMTESRTFGEVVRKYGQPQAFGLGKNVKSIDELAMENADE